jgi:hypothetical protein
MALLPDRLVAFRGAKNDLPGLCPVTPQVGGIMRPGQSRDKGSLASKKP